MVYQPPTGARDLLPLEVTQQRWIEQRLQALFQRWGYHQIMTSTLERLDTLMAGGAVDRATVIQVQSDDDSELGLRPEVTASIARAAATRLGQAPRPLRLFYLANVFRKARQREIYQAGVELLGSGTMLADAETLLLLSDCLAQLGLAQPGDKAVDCSLIVGEAALTRSLLAPFPAQQRGLVLKAIAQLDRVTLEALALSSELRHIALTLLDLRGQPRAVLKKLRELPLTPPQEAIAQRLEALTELLGQRLRSRQAPHAATTDAPQGPDQEREKPSPIIPEIILDLSLVQTFDYYSGIVFEVACRTPAGTWVVGQGGRYDQLLGLYDAKGESAPGIGFCLEIENLQQVLKSAERLPQTLPINEWLVVPWEAAAYEEAIQYAHKLKGTAEPSAFTGAAGGEPVRVELYLEALAEEEAIAQATVRAYAREQSIRRIAWIRPGQLPQIETLDA